ncbi:MAG: tetratricopeptide repeat protein [Prevotella sp.]|jgi:tetratricopeptide (TPR) repeat protein|nr:tetratricopeptide repeat protein [Prevotella sp.]
MGFWKTFFGGEANPEEEKKNAEERNFDLLKYDGVKAMRIGQFEYAQKCFQKALDIKDDPEVHDYLSRAYLQLGRNTEALQELQLLLRQEPENVNLMLQAASVAFMGESYTDMAEFCERALAVDADNAMVHLIYAKGELAQGNLVQGIARLTKTIALDERLVEPRLLRGQTLLRMGDLKGAGEDVEWLNAHTDDIEDVLLLSARLQQALGHHNEALAFYSQVIDQNPFQVEAYRERGQIRFEQGDKQGAEEDMQKVMELNPQEMADVSGEYSAEGIEQKTRQAYSYMNPMGL